MTHNSFYIMKRALFIISGLLLCMASAQAATPVAKGKTNTPRQDSAATKPASTPAKKTATPQKIAVKPDTVTRNIQIVKEYTPDIKEANKVNTQPELKDASGKKQTVNYSVWTAPKTLNNDSVPTLDYALPNAEVRADLNKGFVKLGAGNYTSFLGEAYLPLYSDKRNLFDLYGRHNSSFGNVKFTNNLYDGLKKDFETKGLVNDNYWRGSYLRNSRQKEMSFYADFGYNRFDYYGYEGGEDTSRGNYDRKQAFTRFDIGGRYRTKEFVEKWSYDAQLNYQLFHTLDKLNEHTVLTAVNVKYKVDNGLLNLDAKMYNMFLGLPDSSARYNFKNADNTSNNTVIIFAPAYLLNGSKWQLHIGAKGAFCMGQGRLASISPDIYGSAALVPKYWFLYAGVTGEYLINSYRNMAETNRYVAADTRAEDTYIPIDVYIGSKFNLMKRISLDINASYKVYSNPYFFVADSIGGRKSSLFNVVYGENDGLLSAGAAINVNVLQKVDFSLKAKVNKWALSEGETAWMMPTSELTATLTYKPTSYLRFNAAYNFQGGRDAMADSQSVKMNNISDLSFGAVYQAMSRLNIFLNLNNVLGNQYEYWYGYACQRFNLMGGLTFTF